MAPGAWRSEGRRRGRSAPTRPGVAVALAGLAPLWEAAGTAAAEGFHSPIGRRAAQRGTLQRGSLQRGTLQRGTLHRSTLHRGTFQRPAQLQPLTQQQASLSRASPFRSVCHPGPVRVQMCVAGRSWRRHRVSVRIWRRAAGWAGGSCLGRRRRRSSRIGAGGCRPRVCRRDRCAAPDADRRSHANTRPAGTEAKRERTRRSKQTSEQIYVHI
jgi:hypothetical protein